LPAHPWRSGAAEDAAAHLAGGDPHPAALLLRRPRGDAELLPRVHLALPVELLGGALDDHAERLGVGVAVDLERHAVVDGQLQELRARRRAKHDGRAVARVIHGEDVDLARRGRGDPSVRCLTEALPAFVRRKPAGWGALVAL